MHIHPKRLITVIIAISTGPVLFAAEPGPADTIIVTATRTEIPLQHATVPVTVISRQDIELSLASDLAELLRFEGGIELGRNGGPGQATSIFLRGTESNHTLVLMDGVRINPGTIGGAALQNIAPEMIERVEIVKGARSALFGTDAIGGVINIITRRSKQTYAEGSVGFGSFDTRSAYLAGGNEGDRGGFGITLNLHDTAGFPTRTESNIASGYDNGSINVHAERRFDRHEIGLRHWSATGTTEYLDFFLAPLDQDYRNLSTTLELISDLGRAVESRLLLSHVIDDISQNQSEDFVESTRQSLDWQLSAAAGEHLISGGIFLMDENAATASFGSGFDEDTAVKAVFVQDQWSRDRHRVFLAARHTDHETFGSRFAWNVEYAYLLSDRWTLKGGAGHAFRAPDATDRYGFGGNPDLEPELADETQLGVTFSPDDRQSLSLELYRKDIDDLIEFDLSTFELRNIARAEIRGAELGWQYRGDSFALRASFVRQQAENTTDGVRLLRRAEESMTFRATKDLGRHRLGVAVIASGDREDFGGVVLPGYALVNLTGQFALGDHMRLNARIENLLDTEYETAAGFRMQERSGFIALQYAWK